MMGRQLHPPGPIYSAQPQLQLPVACVPVRFANRDDDDGDSNSDNSAGLALGPCWDAGSDNPGLALVQRVINGIMSKPLHEHLMVRPDDHAKLRMLDEWEAALRWARQRRGSGSLEGSERRAQKRLGSPAAAWPHASMHAPSRDHSTHSMDWPAGVDLQHREFHEEGGDDDEEEDPFPGVDNHSYDDSEDYQQEQGACMLAPSGAAATVLAEPAAAPTRSVDATARQAKGPSDLPPRLAAVSHITGAGHAPAAGRSAGNPAASQATNSLPGSPASQRTSRHSQHSMPAAAADDRAGSTAAVRDAAAMHTMAAGGGAGVGAAAGTTGTAVAASHGLGPAPHAGSPDNSSASVTAHHGPGVTTQRWDPRGIQHRESRTASAPGPVPGLAAPGMSQTQASGPGGPGIQPGPRGTVHPGSFQPPPQQQQHQQQQLQPVHHWQQEQPMKQQQVSGGHLQQYIPTAGGPAAQRHDSLLQASQQQQQPLPLPAQQPHYDTTAPAMLPPARVGTPALHGTTAKQQVLRQPPPPQWQQQQQQPLDPAQQLPEAPYMLPQQRQPFPGPATLCAPAGPGSRQAEQQPLQPPPPHQAPATQQAGAAMHSQAGNVAPASNHNTGFPAQVGPGSSQQAEHISQQDQGQGQPAFTHSPQRTPQGLTLSLDGLSSEDGDPFSSPDGDGGEGAAAADPSIAQGGRRYRGVQYVPSKKKWRVAIKTGKVKRHLGYFTVPEVAARVYDRAALILHKNVQDSSRHLNFPASDYAPGSEILSWLDAQVAAARVAAAPARRAPAPAPRRPRSARGSAYDLSPEAAAAAAAAAAAVLEGHLDGLDPHGFGAADAQDFYELQPGSYLQQVLGAGGEDGAGAADGAAGAGAAAAHAAPGELTALLQPALGAGAGELQMQDSLLEAVAAAVSAVDAEQRRGGGLGVGSGDADTRRLSDISATNTLTLEAAAAAAAAVVAALEQQETEPGVGMGPGQHPQQQHHAWGAVGAGSGAAGCMTDEQLHNQQGMHNLHANTQVPGQQQLGAQDPAQREGGDAGGVTGRAHAQGQFMLHPPDGALSEPPGTAAPDTQQQPHRAPTQQPRAPAGQHMARQGSSQSDLVKVEGYMGVYWARASGRYKVYCSMDTGAGQKTKVKVGEFGTLEEAARAYDGFVLHTRGPGARINFPVEQYLHILPPGSGGGAAAGAGVPVGPAAAGPGQQVPAQPSGSTAHGDAGRTVAGRPMQQQQPRQQGWEAGVQQRAPDQAPHAADAQGSRVPPAYQPMHLQDPGFLPAPCCPPVATRTGAERQGSGWTHGATTAGAKRGRDEGSGCLQQDRKAQAVVGGRAGAGTGLEAGSDVHMATVNTPLDANASTPFVPDPFLFGPAELSMHPSHAHLFCPPSPLAPVPSTRHMSMTQQQQPEAGHPACTHPQLHPPPLPTFHAGMACHDVGGGGYGYAPGHPAPDHAAAAQQVHQQPMASYGAVSGGSGGMPRPGSNGGLSSGSQPVQPMILESQLRPVYHAPTTQQQHMHRRGSDSQGRAQAMPQMYGAPHAVYHGTAQGGQHMESAAALAYREWSGMGDMDGF